MPNAQTCLMVRSACAIAQRQLELPCHEGSVRAQLPTRAVNGLVQLWKDAARPIVT